MTFAYAFAALAAIALFVIVAGQIGAFSGTMPTDLGVNQGKLKAPSGKPNSVSSQANYWPNTKFSDAANIDPISFQGDGKIAMEKLVDVIKKRPHLRIIERRTDYVYVQAKSKWFGFIDDIEFWLEPQERIIHVRSSSRLGYRDFDINRKRIEDFRVQFTK